jgi:hypothetical protein
VREKAPSRRSFASTNATHGGMLRESTGTTKSELAANEDDVVREKATSRRSFVSTKAEKEDNVVREKPTSRRSFASTEAGNEDDAADGPLPVRRLKKRMML